MFEIEITQDQNWWLAQFCGFDANHTPIIDADEAIEIITNWENEAEAAGEIRLHTKIGNPENPSYILARTYTAKETWRKGQQLTDTAIWEPTNREAGTDRQDLWYATYSLGDLPIIKLTWK